MIDESTQVSTKRRCRSIVVFGCGLILLVSVLFIILIVLNWSIVRQNPFVSSLVSLVRYFSNDSSEILQLRKSLIASYASDDISINIRHYASASSGEVTNALEVQFVNPAFIDDLYQASAEEQARQIAINIAAKYPFISSYDVIAIKFIKSRGVVASPGQSATFRFETRDLFPMDEID